MSRCHYYDTIPDRNNKKYCKRPADSKWVLKVSNENSSKGIKALVVIWIIS